MPSDPKLGTGTSGCVPNVSCLTSKKLPPCPTCHSSTLPSGRKNHRRNTGALIRLRSSHAIPLSQSENESSETADDDEVLVIDAGKSFLASAQEWFPKYGLRRIAAVVLTHAHADAMNGLDDLRGWTLGGSIQEHIDVYLSRETFHEIKRAFPYLVAKEFATGGGDVPEFRYHFFENGIPFSIRQHLHVTPVAVHHGRFFSAPLSLSPSRLVSNANLTRQPVTLETPPAEPTIVPYTSYGFIIETRPTSSPQFPGNEPRNVNAEISRIVYLSDVSHIPEDSWDILLRHRPSTSSSDSLPVGSSSTSSPQPPSIQKRHEIVEVRIPASLVIIDTLRPEPHASHYGLAQAYSTVKRLLNTSSIPDPAHSSSPSTGRGYMVGFSHELTHAEWQVVSTILNGGKPPIPVPFSTTLDDLQSAPKEQWRMEGGGIRPASIQRSLKALGAVVPSLRHDHEEYPISNVVTEDERLDLRAGWDGMRVFVRGQQVYDEEP